MTQSHLQFYVLILMLFALAQCKPKQEAPSSPPSTESTQVSPAAQTINRPTVEQKELILGLAFDQRHQALRNAQYEVIERLVQTRAKTQLLHANADNDAQKQKEQIEKMIQEGANYLLVFPIDLKELSSTLQGALAKKINVVIFSAPTADSSKQFAYIYADQYQIGYKAGEEIGKALQAKAHSEGPNAPIGRVIQIRGDESDASVKRGLGFREGLASVVGQVLVHDAPVFWNLSAVSARLEEAIRLHPHFNAIYAHDDLLAEAAHDWVRKSDHKLNRDEILIMGTDGYPGEGAGQDLVQKNRVDLTIYHPPLVDVAWEKVLEHLEGHLPILSKAWEVSSKLMNLETFEDLANQGIQKPTVVERELFDK